MNEREELMAQVRKRYALVREELDERGRRQVLAAEALAIGWGGVRLVADATGVARATITLGIKEQRGQVPPAPAGKQRRPGGGRKTITVRDPAVLAALERLVEPTTRGDPESPLRWTCKSLRKLAAELCAQGHRVSHEWVRGTLRAIGYSLQANRKTREGGDHPDRDAQFEHINDTRRRLSGCRRSGDLGGYQEEGTGGGLQEWGPRVAPQGAAGGRCGCTTSRARSWGG